MADMQNGPESSSSMGGRRKLPEKAPWWRPGRYFAARRAVPIEQRSYTKIY
jgi:hypothetical protein